MKQKESRVQRFPSLRAIRDEHNRLVKWYRSHREDPEQLNEDQIRKFLTLAVETGALLDTNQERQAGQSILDYWSTVLYQEKQESVEATLADYDPASEGGLEDSECPYPGLEPFDDDRWVMYFGRDRQCERIRERLSKEAGVVLVGATGVGKTSLLRAGVLPALRDRGLHPATKVECLPVVVPGCDPLGNLARVIGSDDPDGIARHIKGFHGSSDYLERIIEERSRQPVVLAVDGLEELVTLSPEPDARAFADNIIPLMRAGRGKHILILTIRSGAMADLEKTFPELQRLVKERQEIMEPLDAIGVQMAITSPAERVGLRFEEGLVDALVRDFLGEPPALLQLTLLNLWARRIGTRVDWKAYAELGRGRAALQNLAEQASAAWSESERVAAKSMLLRLFQPGAHAGEIRGQRVQKSELLKSVQGGQAGTVLEAFSERGLIRITESNTRGDLRVEPIHDVLVDSWPELRAWTHDRELEAERARAERERARAERETTLRQKATRFTMAFATSFLAAAGLAWLAVSQLNEIAMLNTRADAYDLHESNPDLSLALAAWAWERSPRSPESDALLMASAYSSSTRRVFEPRGEQGAIAAVAISPDGDTILAGAVDGSVVVWNAADGKESERRFRAHEKAVQSIAVSANSRQILTGGDDGRAILWDFEGRDVIREWSAGDSIAAVALSANAGLALLGARNPVLWDLKTDEKYPLRGHKNEVLGVAFVPGGERPTRAVTGSQDGAVILWDLDTRTEIKRMEKHQDEVRSVAVSPDGCLAVSGSRDGTIIAWNICLGEGSEPEIYLNHSDVITSIVFSPDGRFLYSGSQDREIIVWSVETGSRLRPAHHVLRGHTARVLSLGVTNNPQGDLSLVSGSQDGTVRLWDVHTGLPLWRVGGEGPKKVRSATLSENSSSLWSFFPDGNFVSWDMTRPQASPAKFPIGYSADKKAPKPVFSQNRRFLYRPNNPTSLVLSRISEQEPVEEHHLRGRQVVTATALSSDGSLALAADTKRQLTLWNVAEEKIIKTFQSGHEEKIRSVALSENGTMAASASNDSTVGIWDLKTGKGARFSGHMDVVRAVAFRPGNTQLASGSRDGTVILWDFQGNVVGRYRRHRNEVRSLVFDPSGRMLLSASEDGSVVLWHVDSRRHVNEFIGHTDRVLSIDLSADGRYAVSASNDGDVIVWGLLKLPADSQGSALDALAHHRYIRELNEEECRNFGLGRWPLSCP